MIDERTIKELVDRLNRLEATKAERRYAIVTDDSPFTIQFSGGDPITGIMRLSSYTPTTNDKVLVLIVGGDFIVLGEPVS